MINFSGIISRTAFVYIYTFILARMLPVGELGEFFLMFTIINLLGLAAMVGLDMGVVRFVSMYVGEKKYSLARRVVLGGVLVGLPVGIAMAVLLFFAAPTLSRYLFDGSQGAIEGLRVFALALPFMVAARLFNATTQGMHRMQYQVYSRDIGEQIFKVVLSLLLLALGAGLMGVVWANVTAVMLAAGLSLMFALMVLPRKPDYVTEQIAEGKSGSEYESPARLILRYSYPLAMANIIVALWLQIDTLLLGYFGSSSQVGYYGVAMKLALFISKSITAFATVFTPVIADLWNREKREELKQLYVTISRWIFTVSLPVFLIMAIFSDSMLRIFGSGFETGSTALIILAGGQLISAATGAAGVMVMMSGRSKLELLNVTAALTVNVTLCIMLIPDYGVIGAAIAHMSSIVIVNVIRIIEILFFMRMFAYDRSLLKPLIAGTAAALVAVALDRFVIGATDIAQLAVLASILLIFYVLAIFFLGLSDQDKMLFSRIKAGTSRFRTT